MCQNMPKTIKEERLRWVLPIFRKEVKLVDVAKVCPHGKRSLERWLVTYSKHGEAGLEPQSTRPKTNPRETPIRIKERIIEIRKKEKQCAKKISWDLEDEGVVIHYQTVQKIIKKEEIVEMDVKFVPEPIDERRCYQFPAIDCGSRWRHLQAYENIDNE